MNSEVLPNMNGAQREDASAYRSGLQRAMTLVWREKIKHLVVSETHFAMQMVWEQLNEETRLETPGRGP